jgi:AcrR family transcriptional regulator
MTAEPRKRGRPRLDRRLEVIRTAARLFAEHGYRQATLEEVAGALHMTRSALYYYADSKDELLRQCGAEANVALAEALEHARGGATGYERVTRFFARYAGFVCDDFGRCFALTDPREIAETDRAPHLQSRRTLTHAIETMVAEGVEDGSIRPCDPVDVVRILYGAFNNIARWYRPGGKRSPTQIATDYLALMAPMLRA